MDGAPGRPTAPGPEPRSPAPFFTATSVAVIGASKDHAKRAGRPLYFMRRHGYTGEAFAVNPRHDEVMGYPCVPTVADLPAGVELAVLAVQAPAVTPALRACHDHGIPAAVVLANGFADAGDEPRQRELQELVAATGVRLLGPNTLGCMNVHTALSATSASPLLKDNYARGQTAVVTQSGSLANSILQGLKARDVGISKWVATGNELDTDALGVVEYLAGDPETRTIAMLVEAGRSGARWAEAGRRAAAAGTSVVVMKIGRTEEGRRAAISHTGRAGGSYAAWRQIAEESGFVVVETLAELTDVTAAMSVRRDRSPGPHGLAVLGTGGMGVIASDESARRGVPLVPFTPGTRRALAGLLPAGATVSNPVDPTPVDDETYFEAGAIAAADPNVRGVLVVMTSLVRDYSRAVERLVALQRHAQRHDAFVLVTYLSADDRMTSERERELRAAGIVVTGHPEQAVAAFRGVVATERGGGGPGTRGASSPATAPPAAASRRGLGWADLAERLRGHALPMLYPVPVGTRDEAAAVAATMGPPVVMKAEGPGLEHKADHDAVRLGIGSPDEAAKAFDELAWALDRPGRLICVQEQAEPGLELRAGCVRDPELGPLVTVGAGGGLTELIDDNRYAPCPVDAETAARLLMDTRIWPALRRQLERCGHDLAPLARFVSELSRLFVAQPGLRELEVNPVIVNSRGVQGVDVLAAV
jgi:acyl-CoA synthetase (NDP forming)